MSLITRCPACGTMFKVVPDQLRISEGWVRCGHCAEVFDASAHLQKEDESSAPQSVLPLPERVAASEGAPHSEGFASSLHTEISGGLTVDPPDSSQLEDEAIALMELPQDQPFVLRRLDADADVERVPERTQPSPIADEPELHDLSFVRQARRRAFWRRPAVRAMLTLALLLLGALLALQVVMRDRDRLAAADPALRPWLARMCTALQCRIGPPHLIDAIAIDSSSFNKLRPDTYRLNLTLKNMAPTDVAMPALELTLTDAQDQAIVRRVIPAGEFAPNRGVIAAGGEWAGSVALGVTANGSAARIAGYRLLAFYP